MLVASGTLLFPETRSPRALRLGYKKQTESWSQYPWAGTCSLLSIQHSSSAAQTPREGGAGTALGCQDFS